MLSLILCLFCFHFVTLLGFFDCFGRVSVCLFSWLFCPLSNWVRVAVLREMLSFVAVLCGVRVVVFVFYICSCRQLVPEVVFCGSGAYDPVSPCARDALRQK